MGFLCRVNATISARISYEADEPGIDLGGPDGFSGLPEEESTRPDDDPLPVLIDEAIRACAASRGDRDAEPLSEGLVLELADTQDGVGPDVTLLLHERLDVPDLGLFDLIEVTLRTG
jgi:hypothetical protein